MKRLREAKVYESGQQLKASATTPGTNWDPGPIKTWKVVKAEAVPDAIHVFSLAGIV